MKIYFATGNAGKAKHASEILGESFEVEQVDVETIEPQSKSIDQIAEYKVEQAIKKSDIEEDAFVLADDSGLFVDSLNGFPGPLSSPFDSKVGKEKILDLVDEGSEAEFRSAIGLYNPQSNEIEVFTGSAKGELVEPKGEDGFGYDPLFLPKGNDKTWAEDPEYKNKVSHRKEALEKLREYLQEVEN